jgi:hypothetical protein
MSCDRWDNIDLFLLAGGCSDSGPNLGSTKLSSDVRWNGFLFAYVQRLLASLRVCRLVL